MADEKINLELATNVTVTDIDGDHTAIVFTTKDGKNGAVLENQVLSNVVSAIIRESVKAAAKRSPRKSESEMLSVLPVPATRISWAQGRSPSEAILRFEIGNLNLQIAVELGLLMELLARISAGSEKDQGGKLN
jgi:hypothetical protein